MTCLSQRSDGMWDTARHDGPMALEAALSGPLAGQTKGIAQKRSYRAGRQSPGHICSRAP